MLERRLGLLAAEGSGTHRPSSAARDLADEPGPAQGGAADHHAGGAGGAQQRRGVLERADIAIGDHRDVDGLPRPRRWRAQSAVPL